jgi:peptidoglycan/xylan/chitin deacetylase (PgdA/CDA1 family)
MCITFDDGYRNNHDVVVPILRRHGLRATFFVSTRFIDERRPFWWDRIAYLVKRSPRERLALAYPHDLVFDLRSDREAAVTTLCALVKTTYGLDIERLLGELSTAAGVPWERELERRIADDLLLTWDQVRGLRDAGMEVQSHTATHRVLATMARAEVDADLAEARRVLEREIATPVHALSYPCGDPIEHDPDLVEGVRAAGYQFGFAACGGRNQAGDHRTRPLHLARVTIESNMSLALFRGVLAVPYLAAK